jgi:hypothetical protein
VITPEQLAEIRRLFHAEHFRIGTIADVLDVHPDTVRSALKTEGFNRARIVRAAPKTDPFLGLIRETLERYPRLRATRVFAMIRARGYAGSVVQLLSAITFVEGKSGRF